MDGTTLKTCKKYKISDNGLRKICKRINVPIPAMGHWQKIQYGKRVTITRLPEKHEGKDEIILHEKRDQVKLILIHQLLNSED